jgi:hypothetical protein
LALGVKAAMFSILILIAFLYAAVKLNGDLSSHLENFEANSVTAKEVLSIRVFMWLYLVVLLITIFPVPPLNYLLYPVPVSILFLLPGIFKGKKLGAVLEVSGNDRGVAAGRVVSNITWLGIGVGIYIIVVWGVGWFVATLPDSI